MYALQALEMDDLLVVVTRCKNSFGNILKPGEWRLAYSLAKAF